MCDYDYCQQVLLAEGITCMHVISNRTLREFWESRKHDALDAKKYLSAWHKLAEKAEWSNFGELKQTFGSADQVGNCTVFDVGNNRFRLIGHVHYETGRLFVLKVMDHQEYDKKLWIESCECHKRKKAKRKEIKP
jgi:mRNA interferase HigB